MIFDILLVPIYRISGEGVLQFQWNEETGEFTGHDAARARALVDEDIAAGYAEMNPQGCAHKLGPDPYRSRSDLAAIFSTRYSMSAVWSDAMPAAIIDNEGDTPGGITPLN